MFGRVEFILEIQESPYDRRGYGVEKSDHNRTAWAHMTAHNLHPHD